MHHRSLPLRLFLSPGHMEMVSTFVVCSFYLSVMAILVGVQASLEPPLSDRFNI